VQGGEEEKRKEKEETEKEEPMNRGNKLIQIR
jgi:hypothetical protein